MAISTLCREQDPPWRYPRAAYVHVPFCAHHCGYCDFAVVTGKDDRIDAYLDALAAEMATLEEPQPVDTLFLGGGTPTHLDACRLKRLLAMSTAWLPPKPGHEFTVEANPGTLDDAKVSVLADYGVTRVSLGVQSFRPESLRVLERNHVPADVPGAIDRVRQCIEHLSLDLIFGVPGQSLEDWRHDLRAALILEPDHVSTYGLTYEKGTRLWRQRELGSVEPLDEEAELAQYEYAIDTLEAAGYEHYEISNFALPGCRSRHNQVYWANHAYFGFGLGAARYVNGCREVNTRDFDAYVQKSLTGQSAVASSESLAPEERARETMAIQLRRAEGIHRSKFIEQTGFHLDALAGPQLVRYTELGLLLDDGSRVRLSRRGQYVADTVISELL